MQIHRISSLVTKTVSPGIDGHDDDVLIGHHGMIAPTGPKEAGAVGIYVAPGLIGVNIVNLGTVSGANAEYSQSIANAVPAAAGVDLNSGRLVNQGSISGGGGTDNFYGAYKGATGVILTDGLLTNRGNIAGGAGGTSQDYIGVTAGGGTGVMLSGDGMFINSNTIIGGAGSNLHNPFYDGGFGGAGGAGVDLSAGTGYNSGLIAGGSGGSGWNGGSGGNGATISGGILTNTGTIVGGAGGYGYGSVPHVRYGGAGGSGIYLDGGTLINAGVIEGGVNGSMVFAAQVSGDGVLELGSGATATLQGTCSVASIAFDPSPVPSSLNVREPGSFTSTISGFGSLDTINLSSVDGTTSLSFSDGVLTVYGYGKETDHQVTDQLKFAGNYTTANFSFSGAPEGGTVIGSVAT